MAHGNSRGISAMVVHRFGLCLKPWISAYTSSSSAHLQILASHWSSIGVDQYENHPRFWIFRYVHACRMDSPLFG